MLVTMIRGEQVEENPVQKLWLAVIASTVDEWVNGPLRQKREAEEFLFTDTQDFRTVCYSAGIDPQNLRSRLEKIRSLQNAEAHAITARN